jgi:cephalosporin hydroxylase
LRKFADLFYAHQGRLVDKWEHYFPIYDKHFAKYQDKPVRVLEIGVSHGGSLQLWKQYFGAKAEIIGLDIDPRCEAYEEDQIQIYAGDQSQLSQSPDLAAFLGPVKFDIVIDDGSHVIAHQEASFAALWPNTSGVYLIEDCHSGYPSLKAPEAFHWDNLWMSIRERPNRIIRGEPSRELRQDEIESINLYGQQ